MCENPAVLRAAAATLGARSKPLVCTEGVPSAAAHTLLRYAPGAVIRWRNDFDWTGVRLTGLVIPRACDVGDDGSMSWDVLDDYGLRNLPAVLVAARRWDDLRDTVFDPGYLRAVVSRIGPAALAQSLGAVVDGPEVPTPMRARCVDLRGLIVEEAGFLSARQYAGLAGPFRNHLDVAWVRLGRPAEQSPLSGDVADLGPDVGQEGWLDLLARTGQATRRATLFFMPGRRENFVSDIRYYSGPAGVETFLAVDLKRMHLLGETISYNYTELDASRWPDHYNWRIWDLRSGALLVDESGGDSRDQPPPFGVPDLERSLRGYPMPVPELLADRFAEFRTGFGCANGTELIFTGLDGQGVFRCVVTDHECRTVLVDVATPPTVAPRVMIRLDDRLVLLGVGEDDHIYRVDLDDGSGDLPDIGRPYPLPDDDPVVRLGHWDSDRDSFKSFPSAPKPPHELEKPKGGYRSGQDSLGGMFLAPGGFVVELLTTAIGVWEFATGRWLGQVRATGSTPGALLRGGFAVSPDGRRIVSANPPNRICVWNVDELAAEPPSPFGASRDRPDWVLGGIALPARVARLAFLSGGQLLAAVAENHELLVLRFRADSAILARIGLDEEVVRIITEPDGASITCVGRSGAMSTYRFRYLPAAHE